ncbi:MAG: 50S ribosomal protein L1 [Candidatus Dojkabacteria bacterium]
MKKEVKKITEVKTLEEAAKLLPEVSTSKFVGSVDVDIVLNLKDKQKKETIRGSFNLPNSLGEEKKVIVFCEESYVKDALAAGAVEAGLDELVEKVMKGSVDFDIVIATPSAMVKMARLGKVLGPKGLMPNPKNGTITTDIAKSIESFKAGRLNFKSVPDQGLVRMKVAKVDMGAEKIQENVLALLKAVHTEVKRMSSTPFKQVTIKPTMGSSIKLDVSDIMKQM